MGNNFATEMTDGTLEDLGIHLTLEQQISIQLTSNHYPPVPTAMIQPCIEAIQACNEDESNRLIQLPIDGVDRNGEPFQITWRGQDSAPAWAIVEGHHLDPWIYNYDDEDYYEED